MAAHLPDTASRAKILTGLLIAALVNGAWLLLFQWSRQSQPKPEVRSVVEMRLLAKAKEPPPPARVSSVARGVMARPFLSRQEELPAELTAPTPATPSTQTPATAAPLRLSLPPERAASGPRAQSMLSQMLSDPRANSPKRGVEYAIADAAGTLPVTAEASTDGTDSKIIRQGSKCTRVSKPRISTLHPMDESARGFISGSGSC